MTNFTTNTYEIKRKIVNFSEKISDGLDKITKKFVMDMEYGLAKSQSVLLANISRALDEDIKLKNTIERLSDNMILLTNRSIHSKEDVIKVVRLHFSRWRVEVYFRTKKTRVWFWKYES